MLRALVAALAPVGFAQQATSRRLSPADEVGSTHDRTPRCRSGHMGHARRYQLRSHARAGSDLTLKQRARRIRSLSWSQLPSWKNQTLTPNPDAVYLMPFFQNTRAGPMVLEIPPASDEGDRSPAILLTTMRGKFLLRTMGPAGVDKGKGGKFLVLPPGYKDKVAVSRVTLRFPPKPMAVSPCCAQFSGAGPTPTSPKRSPTASASNSIP